MNKQKEKSAVGAATPATEKENITKVSIADSEKKIKMIAIEKLLHHPDNPRKDIGDISELTDSIKKNGIMQNLTVIPKEDQFGDQYWVLIGNRRYEAAKAAGVTKLPCKVVNDLSKAEQLGIMLEENMQRNDLTIIEQAQGFQLMLDLGETVETIAQRTGFSQTTVRHRLKIAELDPEVLKQKTEEFQLSMTDMIALERISDPEKRDKILKEAKSHDGLICAIDREVANQDMETMKAIVLTQMQDRKIPEKKVNSWDSDWERLIEIQLWHTDREKFREEILPKLDEIEVTEDVIYTIGYSAVYVMRKKKKEKTVVSEEEKALIEKQKRQNKNIEKIKAISQKYIREMRIFVEQRIIEASCRIGYFSCSERELRWIWYEIVERQVDIDRAELYEVICKDYKNDEEKKKQENKMRHVPVALQMLFFLVFDIEDNPWTYFVVDHTGKYRKEAAANIDTVYGMLDGFGFVPSDKEELEDILSGESELYVREEKENV